MDMQAGSEPDRQVTDRQRDPSHQTEAMAGQTYRQDGQLGEAGGDRQAATGLMGYADDTG